MSRHTFDLRWLVARHFRSLLLKHLTACIHFFDKPDSHYSPVFLTQRGSDSVISLCIVIDSQADVNSLYARECVTHASAQCSELLTLHFFAAH